MAKEKKTCDSANVELLLEIDIDDKYSLKKLIDPSLQEKALAADAKLRSKSSSAKRKSIEIANTPLRTLTPNITSLSQSSGKRWSSAFLKATDNDSNDSDPTSYPSTSVSTKTVPYFGSFSKLFEDREIVSELNSTDTANSSKKPKFNERSPSPVLVSQIVPPNKDKKIILKIHRSPAPAAAPNFVNKVHKAINQERMHQRRSIVLGASGQNAETVTKSVTPPEEGQKSKSRRKTQHTPMDDPDMEIKQVTIPCATKKQRQSERDIERERDEKTELQKPSLMKQVAFYRCVLRMLDTASAESYSPLNEKAANLSF